MSAKTGRWLTIEANRLTIAGIFLSLVLIIFGSFALAEIFVIRTLQPYFYLFGAILTANVTLLTIVLSINQLVLARQFNAPGRLREQISDVDKFRADVRQSIGGGSLPVLPPTFMRMLLEGTRRKLTGFREALDDFDDHTIQRSCLRFADQIDAETDEVESLLAQSENRLVNALSSVLNRNIATEIYGIERLRDMFDSGSQPAVEDALQDLEENLRHINIAREYFKTIYLQKELAYLSKVLLYVTIPAELLGIMTLALFASWAEPTVSTSYLLPLIVISITVGLAPLAVLFSFILRIVTIAARNIGIIPFTTPRQVP